MRPIVLKNLLLAAFAFVAWVSLLPVLPATSQSPVAPVSNGAIRLEVNTAKATSNPAAYGLPSDDSGTPQAVKQSAASSSLRPENARKAREAYSEGLRAERIGDWEKAFAAFTQAVDVAPKETAYRVRLVIAREQLVRQRTDEAEREILSGQEESARASLGAALRLDPSDSVARERLQQISADVSPSVVPEEASLGIPTGLTHVRAAAGARNFDYRGTTRGAYQEIARQFGLTAQFDADLPDRQVQFHVSSLDFETAVRVLGEETGTFWLPVNPQTFFVAPDTQDKHREYEPEVKKTILLPASETNDEMTETNRMIREIAGVRRSDLDTNSHTITIRDTEENVALAQALINEVEQPRGEVVLDIDILEVDRTLARNMGITPPETASSFTLNSSQVRQLEQATNFSTLETVLQSIFGAQNPLAAANVATTAVLPSLIAFGGGKSIFLATLPNASATLSQSLSVVKSAQRVLLRVADGRPATFFVGEHYPITLSLLSNSLVIPATQFTSAVPAGSFPRTDYLVGTNPTAATIADFNGDSKLDLAIANQASNNVSVLLGKGDGTFNTPTTVVVGTEPVAIVASDFNKDGKQDLAVVNHADNTVSILLGNGDGTFAASGNLTVGTGPVAIVSADFNKDGNVDLAVVNQTANTISILLGNGDGTFQAKQDFAVGNLPSAIAFGDFNNDGNIDIGVTNRGSNTFSVLSGDGNGSFTTRKDFATGNGPSAIATADFNNDGRLDIALTNQTDDTLSVYLGNGDGTFQSATNVATGGGPSALIGADFNVDGLPDLAVANETDNTVSVFLGLGNGSFAPALTLSAGTAPVALVQGDLTSTMLPDLAVVNQGSNSVSVFVNNSQISVNPNASETAYPGSEYVDLGLKVHAMPRMHRDNEVTLDLQFDISAVTGQNVNGIPILSNRTIAQSVRLRDDQISVLSGIVQRSEIRSVNGLPWLAEAGTAGYLFGTHSKQESDTELLIAITPRQVRMAPRSDRTIYAGRGEGTVGGAAPGVAVPTRPVAVPIPGNAPGTPQLTPPLPNVPVFTQPGAPTTPTQPAPTTPAQATPAPSNPATPPANE